MTERCDAKEDVVTIILSILGHVERVEERRLRKEIYAANLDGNAVREKPRQTSVDQIDQVQRESRSRVPETGEYEEFDRN
jgi:hypothetical protein